jgi:hypothetical protein
LFLPPLFWRGVGVRYEYTKLAYPEFKLVYETKKKAGHKARPDKKVKNPTHFTYKFELYIPLIKYN